MVLVDTFKDAIFLKETSNIYKKNEALTKLSKEYPNNEKIKEELYMIRKGIKGEQEVKYQLSKSNIGMYILRDINLKYENLTAQIDYVVVTRYYCYFIECKNISGNILINDKGDFLIKYNYGNRKGINSPLRQVEAQRDVFKKVWNNCLSSSKIINYIRRTLKEKSFTDIYRVLVCSTNAETVIDTKYAPKDIKDRIVRADGLVRKIKSDLDRTDKTLWESKSNMKSIAEVFMSLNVKDKTDYYNYYKNKLVVENKTEVGLKEKLIYFRTQRSKEMNIPAYYIFTNEELDRIIKIVPNTINDLKDILPDVKVNHHGKEIIEIINTIKYSNT